MMFFYCDKMLKTSSQSIKLEAFINLPETKIQNSIN
ncbi:hypothetical protein L8106_28716 [Lyngbya sp. PCC 8106]|nr:hypothetical protein L8106_28716 [Lyngbya sp. PCC 8106]